METDQTFASVQTGSGTACALTFDGRIYCWGGNRSGRLGRDPAELAESSVPVPIAGERRYRSLHMKGTFACAVGMDDLVYCWGSNAYGQLGQGDYASRWRAEPVVGQQGS